MSKNKQSIFQSQSLTRQFRNKVVEIAHVTVLQHKKIPVFLYSIKSNTFKCFKQLNYVHVIQQGHGIDLLHQETFKLRIFDHFSFGDTLDCIQSRWRCGFGGQKHVPKTSFSQSTNCMIAIIVEDVFGLCF